MQVRSIVAGIAFFIVLGSLTQSAAAGPCACNSDVTGNGGPVQFLDVGAVRDCINGNCAGCVNSCDVDCDGNVDYYDAGVVSCAFNGGPNCCAEADGACSGAGMGTPPCVLTTDDYCSVFAGTWNGDLSICQGDNAVDIPAASTWGLTALGIATAIAATLMIRRRFFAVHA